jgi:hypothetical protein
MMQRRSNRIGFFAVLKALSDPVENLEEREPPLRGFFNLPLAGTVHNSADELGFVLFFILHPDTVVNPASWKQRRKAMPRSEVMLVPVGHSAEPSAIFRVHRA